MKLEQTIVSELILECLQANNEDFKALLDDRDSGISVSESEITAKQVQAITLMRMLEFCQYKATRDELVDSFKSIR